MKIQAINIDGKKTENIELQDEIFSNKQKNEALIQSILQWQLNHFKKRKAKTPPIKINDAEANTNEYWFKTLNKV